MVVDLVDHHVAQMVAGQMEACLVVGVSSQVEVAACLEVEDPFPVAHVGAYLVVEAWVHLVLPANVEEASLV